MWKSVDFREFSLEVEALLGQYNQGPMSWVLKGVCVCVCVCVCACVCACVCVWNLLTIARFSAVQLEIWWKIGGGGGGLHPSPP